MLLILVRHGNALNHDVDALRTLSDQGKSEAKRTGQFLQDFLSQLPPSKGSNLKVFHSELLRAKETALILTKELNQVGSLEESHDLLPTSPPEPWLNNLLAFEEDVTISLVGHMPYMGIFAGQLLNEPIGLPTGGCMVFERNQGEDFKLLAKNF